MQSKIVLSKAQALAMIQRDRTEWNNYRVLNIGPVDLTGVDLSNSFLVEYDFRDVDLRGANLSRSDLTKANLTGANLSQVDLSGTELSETQIYYATMGQAQYKLFERALRDSVLFVD